MKCGRDPTTFSFSRHPITHIIWITVVSRKCSAHGFVYDDWNAISTAISCGVRSRYLWTLVFGCSILNLMIGWYSRIISHGSVGRTEKKCYYLQRRRWRVAIIVITTVSRVSGARSILTMLEHWNEKENRVLRCFTTTLSLNRTPHRHLFVLEKVQRKLPLLYSSELKVVRILYLSEIGYYYFLMKLHR